MSKSRTAQLVFLSAACTVGLLGTVACLGLFNYSFKWDFYTFFTNISNYLCLALFVGELVETVRKKEDSYITFQPLLKFVALLGILLTFAVYNLILAPYREPQLNLTFNSISFHVLMPLLTLADWLFFYEKGKIRPLYPLYATVFPLVYTAFIYIHAAILGFDRTILNYVGDAPLIYPYFFYDIETHGLWQAAQWIGILALGFLVTGYILYGVDRLWAAKTGKKR